jgi:hypothetical protein
VIKQSNSGSHFRISEIACARQEEEPVSVAPRCPSQASVDLFATQRDDDYEDELMLDDDEEQSKRVNPILEAKKRKEISRNESPASLNWATPQNDQGKSAIRNPFKKSSAPKDSPRLVIHFNTFVKVILYYNFKLSLF